MKIFWNGFEKQASMTVGRIMEGMAYGLAQRAGKTGRSAQEAAEEVIDAYASKHSDEFMKPWKKVDEETKEVLEGMRELNKVTKDDPATAQYMLDFLKDAFKNIGGGS